MSQVFVNPLEDGGFKILFRKKRSMIGFLEAVLDRRIESLEYMDTEKLGVTIDESKSRFDLAVRFDDGSDCVIEMQRACLKYFNYRAVFYTSHLVQQQATEEHERQFAELKKRNKKPYWNYFYKPVYFIGILANGWGESKTSEGPLLEYYRLKEVTSGDDMKVDYNFIFLRLDRFDKTEEECTMVLDRFAYSLKTMGQAESRPASFSEELMMNLYDDALAANLPNDVAHELLLSGVMTTENDWLVAISEAEERATRKGLENGMKEGLERGMEKGEKMARIEIARNMKVCGVEIGIISKTTGLDQKEIERL